MESTSKIPQPRTPLELEVYLKRSYAREETKAVLKNISLSGAFVELSGIDVSPQDKLFLKLQVAGRERKLTAKVVWVNSAGAGIQFQPANNRDVQIVDDLIYFVETDRVGRRNVIDSIFKKVA